MQAPQQSQESVIELNPARPNPDRQTQGWKKLSPEDESRLFQKAVECQQNMVCLVLDPTGKVLTWNHSAEAMLGYTKTEALKLNISSFFKPGKPDQPIDQNVLEEAAKGNLDLLIGTALPKEGVAFTAEAEIAPLSDEEKSFTGFSIFLRKVKQGNSSAKPGKEERFQHLVNTAPVFIWTADPEGFVTYANQTWQDFLGTSFAGSLGHAHRGIIHPDDLDATMTGYSQAVKNRQPFELECRLKNRNGEYRWIRYSGVPQQSPDGTFIGFTGVGMDITGRKNIELALAESEHRFRSLTDDIPVNIWMADEHTRITHVNKACCDFFGQTLEELIGQEAELIAHPEDLDIVKDIYRDAVRNHKPYNMECRVKRHDGQYRWFLHRGRSTRAKTSRSRSAMRGTLRGWPTTTSTSGSPSGTRP